MTKPDGVREYLRRVSGRLEYPGRQKKAMLREIEEMLLQIPDAEDMTYEELAAAAGDPEEIAASRQEGMDPAKARIARRWRLLARVTILLLLVGSSSPVPWWR